MLAGDMTVPAPASLGAALQEVRGLLARDGVREHALKAEMLAAHVAGCPPLELPLRGGQPLDPQARAELARLAGRVAGGEPVQYALGTVHFHDLVLRCDRRALIPRPETEELVEWVLQCSDLWTADEPVIADAGTGSGCIAVALAVARPPARFLAIDDSAEALALARENAVRYGVAERIEFRRVDLLQGLGKRRLDAVVSNPPYVPSAAWRALPAEIRDHEPRVALDGGEDGLRVIAALVEGARVALKRGGRLFLEIGADQGGGVKRRLEAAGFTGVRIERDLSGLPRLAQAQNP